VTNDHSQKNELFGGKVFDFSVVFVNLFSFSFSFDVSQCIICLSLDPESCQHEDEVKLLHYDHRCIKDRLRMYSVNEKYAKCNAGNAVQLI
jgi:hypothetical protein